MTMPPKATEGPGADSPTNSRYWRDPLFLIGVVDVHVSIEQLVKIGAPDVHAPGVELTLAIERRDRLSDSVPDCLRARIGHN